MTVSPTVPLRALARQLLPFSMRVGLRRLPAVTKALLRPPPAPKRGDAARFPHTHCERASPLRRETTIYEDALQRAKEHNVRLGASRIHGCILAPGETFSWHAVVGPPIRLRGFRPGPELHEGRLSNGPGGGLCQVANLLYWLAVHAGLEVLERHRHDLDLFPDHERTAPFGCGATVFFPTRDLRIRNPHPWPVMLEVHVDAEHVRGAVRMPEDPGFRCEVLEVAHRFVRRDGTIWRENQLVRRTHAGGAFRDEPLSENHARVAYVVPEHQLELPESAVVGGTS
ncbi:VanW family protein [Archangium sp.]|uniref:VanW family protein n=1 Tax=Archangium sp. TaxID=1872627 RepID=UPI00389A2442